jgi:hypothetical protein
LYSYGLIHCVGSCKIASKLIMKDVSFFLKNTPPIVMSSENYDGIVDGPGGLVLSDS